MQKHYDIDGDDNREHKVKTDIITYDSIDNIPNYMIVVYNEFNSILTDSFKEKMTNLTIRLINDIRQWLIGNISLHEVCIRHQYDVANNRETTLDNLISSIYSIANTYDYSHNINDLKFAAQLKRLVKYINGNIALKDL